MDYKNIIDSFWMREKVELTPDDLTKLNMQEIKAWARCSGMGSDAYILFIKKDGTILEYDHHQYTKDAEAFAKIINTFLSSTEEWSLIPCEFRNNLYIRKNDNILKDFLLPYINPLIYIECICRKVLEESNTD